MEDFQKRACTLYISLLPKIAELRFIVKQSNTSIIGISESKLDSSILKRSEDLKLLTVQGGEAELHVIQRVLQKSISNFEGEYPTFSFNKNYQKYTNITSR